MNSKRNIIIIFIGLSSMIFSILAKIQVIPYWYVEPIDYLTLGLSIFTLDIPRLISGVKVNSICSLPFVAVAVLIFSPLSNPFNISIGGIIVIACWLISIRILKKNIDFDNPSYRLKKRLDSRMTEAREDDPIFDTSPKQKIFWVFTLEKKEMVRLHVLNTSVFPIIWGIYCLGLLLKIVDVVLPITIILSILLMIYVLKNSANNNILRSKPFSFLRSVWDEEGKMEDSAKISIITKIGSARGAWYFVVSIGSIMYTELGLSRVIYGPSRIFNMSLNYPGLENLSTVIGTVGVIIIILLPLSYSTILIVSKLKRAKVLTNHFLWLIAPAVLTFTTISWGYPPSQTVFEYVSTQFPTIFNVILGLVGLGVIIHAFILIKLNKNSLLTKTIEKRISYCLIPFFIILGMYISDFSMLLSLAIFPLAWFSLVKINEKVFTSKKTRQDYIILISMIASFSIIGILMLLSRQYSYTIACFVGAIMFGLFLINKQKREKILQKMFGISEIS
ncbi:MAG: hypothetical protein KGI33_12365 [Thaumarchaeota archaeon]|nr:hypothetical protein [Nitrososphaerota archaeon]